MSNRGNVFVISAPSGAGKTTLAQRLLKELPDLRFSISHTTRSPRKGEKDGTDYFFVSREEFQQLVAREAFLEHAEVHGHYYGTTRRFVDEQLTQGKDVLLDIDIQGGLQVREKMPDCLMIFVLPPSMEELENRLRGRGVDDPRDIENRLRTARREIRYYDRYGFIIVNHKIERSVNELKSIVEAARCRLERREAQARRIADSFHDG